MNQIDKKIDNFFTKYQWYFFAIIIVVSLAFRWIDLEARPIHHDESIHLIQGYYYFERPETGYYKYDPMTHGPFLYHALKVVYQILGYSTWAGRAFMALIGSLFLFLPLMFRKYLRPTTVLFLTTLIGLSPSMIYWSRFVRSDLLMLSWWLLILIGVFLASPKWKPFLCFLGIGLQICSKENSYVFYAMMVGYFFFEYALSYFIKDYNRKTTCLYKIYKNFMSHKMMYLISFFTTCLVIYYFFSGGFRYFIESPSLLEKYFGTFLDGLYRKSVKYWSDMHGQERIKGPFLFQFYMMAWHEFILVLCMLIHIIYLSRKKIWIACTFSAAFIISLVLALNFRSLNLEQSFIWNFFKLKNGFDFFGLFMLPTYAVVTTVYHLLRKERGLAFFAYFAGGNLATYCYLGEKVPWLSVYPILSFIIYYSLLFNQLLGTPWREKVKHFKLSTLLLIIGLTSFVLGIIFILESNDFQMKDNIDFVLFGLVLCIICSSFKAVRFDFIKFIFLVFIIYDLRIARIVNFQNAGSEFEIMSQVHTDKQLHNILNGIKETIKTNSLGYEPIMHVSGETNWPTVTYMVGFQQLKYGMDGHKIEDFKYIIEDQESTRREKKKESVIKGKEDLYNSRKIQTRCWWDPDYNIMNMKRFLNYAFNHVPWSGPGFYHAMIHVRKN